jgi:crossover junction endodeoxyribonuclease RuvC
MLVLGLDPGLAITGYGFVEGDSRNLKAVAYGVLRTPPHTPLADRLLQLHKELSQLLVCYHPDVVALEELFFSTNVRTAITVGEARGVLLFTAAEAGLKVAEYTPLQVKQAITGYGQADKAQVQQMVRLLLSLAEIPHPDDAADALAVSICHHHSARMAELVEGKRGQASDR